MGTIMRAGVSALIALTMIMTTTWAQPLPGLPDPAEQDYVTPDPEQCDVEPRTVEEIMELVGDQTTTGAVVDPAALDDIEDLTEPENGPPVYVVPGWERPLGEPADPETTAAATATMETIYACWNARNPLAVFALFDDVVLMELGTESPIDESFIAFLEAEPQPMPEDARESIAVSDVQILEDGNVSLYVTGRFQGLFFIDYVELAEVGDDYLVVSQQTVASGAVEDDE